LRTTVRAPEPFEGPRPPQSLIVDPETRRGDEPFSPRSKPAIRSLAPPLSRRAWWPVSRSPCPAFGPGPRSRFLPADRVAVRDHPPAFPPRGVVSPRRLWRGPAAPREGTNPSSSVLRTLVSAPDLSAATSPESLRIPGPPAWSGRSPLAPAVALPVASRRVHDAAATRAPCPFSWPRRVRIPEGMVRSLAGVEFPVRGPGSRCDPVLAGRLQGRGRALLSWSRKREQPPTFR
jgi:hypothetical protein